MVSFFGSVLISAERETVTQRGTWPPLIVQDFDGVIPLIANEGQGGGQVLAGLQAAG